MLEGGEDLPLVAEAAQDLVGVHAALDDLERDALLELLVRALGQIDHAHAAAADLLDDAVRPDAHAGSERRVVAGKAVRVQLGEERCGEGVDGVADRLLGCRLALEELEHFAAQLLVAVARAPYEGFALGRCDVERGGEQLVDSLPAFRGEGVHRHRRARVA